MENLKITDTEVMWERESLQSGIVVKNKKKAIVKGGNLIVTQERFADGIYKGSDCVSIPLGILEHIKQLKP